MLRNPRGYFFWLLANYKFGKIFVKLGCFISINVFGPGLSLPHRGNILINSQTQIGKNCRIHVGVNIGAHHDKSPRIGNNVYIGSGAIIFGDIEITDNCLIGVNATVNKSKQIPNCTVVGTPAKIIKMEVTSWNGVKHLSVNRNMMKQVKLITVVTNNYPAPGHAVNVFVQQLVHAMIDQGVKVNVVAYQSIVHSLIHKVQILPIHSKGVTDHGIEYSIFRPYTFTTGNREFKFVNWINKKIIERKLASIKSDIIYCHFWSSALPVFEYALNNKIPMFVACGEGDNALEDMVEKMPLKEFEKLAKACTGVVSVSSENRRKCLQFNLATESNIGVFPNCVNTDLFHKMEVNDMKKQLGITDEDFVLSFVGGFIPRKGPDKIAQAVKNLNDPHLKVMFIGRPFPGYPYDFDCPGIIHKGPLNHDLLPKYVNCSDVFVMPTQKEGCCNAIVEALAMGLPVISSDGAFNDDILDEYNSIRINPDDVEALTKAIARLRNDKHLRQMMSEYSLARHKEYTIEGRAERIISFIKDLINR